MFEILNKPDEKLLEECEVRTARGSGPGGTKADTTESAVEIHHDPSGVTARSSTTRSQRKNREIALRNWRRRYALEVRHEIDPDRIGVPPALTSYLENGLRIKQKNDWYPFLAKLVLDVFEACDARLSDTANFLDVSTGRLVAFFKDDSALWQQVNRMREKHGHHRLE